MIFSFSDVDLGITVVSVLQLVRVAQHWGRKGAHLSEKKGGKSECKKFGENSRKTASVSTICDEYCRLWYTGRVHSSGSARVLGVQYIGVFNFRYTVLLCLNLGINYSVTTTCCIKYTMFFLILVFYTSFSIMSWYFGRYISGILVFHHPPPPSPLADPNSLYTVKFRGALFEGLIFRGAYVRLRLYLEGNLRL